MFCVSSPLLAHQILFPKLPKINAWFKNCNECIISNWSVATKEDCHGSALLNVAAQEFFQLEIYRVSTLQWAVPNFMHFSFNSIALPSNSASFS